MDTDELPLERFDRLRRESYALRRTGRYREAFEVATELREAAAGLGSFQQAEADLAWAEACDEIDRDNPLIAAITLRVLDFYTEAEYLSGILRCKLLQGHSAMHGDAPETAEPFFREVIDTSQVESEAVDSPEYTIAAHINLGVLLEQLGRLSEAVDCYRALLDLEQAAPSERVRLLALVNLGGLYSTLGEIRQAVDCLESARALAEAQDDLSSLNRIELALGDIFFNLSQPEKARAHYDHARQLAERSGEPLPLANTLSALAFFECTEGDDLGEAYRLAEQALDIARRARNVESEGTALRVLGAIHRHRGEPGRAWTSLSAALERAKSPSTKHNLELQLGVIALEDDQFELARAHCERALEHARAVGSLDLRHRALTALASVELKLGDPASAYEHLVQGANALENHLLALGREALTTDLVESAEHLYDMLLLLFHAFRSSDDEDMDEEIFHVADRAKSWHILDQMRRFPRLASDDVPTSLLEREAHYRETMATLQSQPIADDPLGLPERIEQAGSELDDVLDEIQRYDLAYVQTKRTPALRVEQACEALLGSDTNALLAEYYLSDVLSFVVLIGSDGVRHYRLEVTEKEIATCVDELQTMIDGDPARGIPSLATHRPWHRDVLGALDIGKKLFPFLDALDEVDVLYVAPHRALHRLPWSCLRVDEETYLIDHVGVCVVPSFSIAVQCRERFRWITRHTEQSGLLAVGIPSVSDTRFASDFDDASWVPTLLEGALIPPPPQPSKSWLLGALNSAQLVHLSCHGIPGAGRPMNAGFLIGAGTDPPDLQAFDREEEVLTAGELAQARIQARLVVARACGSGRVRVHVGDEIQGILRALLYAGSSATVSSLWNNSVRSSKLLLTSMYRIWSQGDPIWKALREAQLLLRSGDIPGWKKAWAHPFHWGAFQLMGYAETTWIP